MAIGSYAINSNTSFIKKIRFFGFVYLTANIFLVNGNQNSITGRDLLCYPFMIYHFY